VQIIKKYSSTRTRAASSRTRTRTCLTDVYLYSYSNIEYSTTVLVKTLSKKMYFQEQFTENKKDSQKTWKLIKNALPANKSKRNQPKIDRIKTGNEEIFET